MARVFTEQESKLLLTLVEEGIDVLQAIKEAKLTEDGRVLSNTDLIDGFEKFLALVSDEETEQMVLEEIKRKLEGGV